MSAASEALADVRGWLCDNLSEGDAGKVCGMLSVVSRHIVELEDENAELRHDRDMFRELFHLTTQPDLYVQVRDENAKLRDMLALYIRQAYVQACDKGNPITVGIIEDDARELGIEVPHD